MYHAFYLERPATEDDDEYKCHCCGQVKPEQDRVVEVFSINMTSNCSAIWYAGLESNGFRDFSQVPDARSLEKVLQWCEAHQNDIDERGQREFKDAANGWGTVKAAVETLYKVVEAWKRNPEAVFKVSR